MFCSVQIVFKMATEAQPFTEKSNGLVNFYIFIYKLYMFIGNTDWNSLEVKLTY